MAAGWSAGDRLTGLVTVAAVLGLVGCGTSGSSRLQTRSPGDSSANANTNAQRAERAADHLLSLAQVPSAAQPLSSAPENLTQPESRPDVESLVDRSKFWKVGMSFDDTLSWLHAHPPSGLKNTGSFNGGGPGYRIGGYVYDAPDAPGVTEQQLQMSITNLNASTTAIRADGMAVWLDPRPIPDTTEGKRLRVTVAHGCPDSRGHTVGVTNDNPQLAKSLLPAGQPTAALVCRYLGANDKPPFGLGNTRTLNQTEARRLADAARAIDLSHVVGGSTSCPMDDGSVTVIVFAYRGQPDIDLWFARTGCQFLSNGSIIANAGNFGAQLARSGTPG